MFLLVASEHHKSPQVTWCLLFLPHDHQRCDLMLRVNGERHCQKDVFCTRPSGISLTTPLPPPHTDTHTQPGLVCWPLHIESDRSVIRLPHLPLMMSHLSPAVFPARAYPSFCSMKQLEVLSLIPPGGDPTTYKYCQVGLTVS